MITIVFQVQIWVVHRMNMLGEYSQESTRAKYDGAFHALERNYQRTEHGAQNFYDNLLKLNNKYLGMGLSAQYLFASTENFPAPNITSANYAFTVQLRDMNGAEARASAMQAALPESSMAAFAGRNTDNDGSATMAMWGDIQKANTAKFRESVRIKEAIYEAEKKIKALEAENISGLNPENKMDILYASTNLSESDLIGKKEFTIENIARAAMGMKTGQQMSGITIGQLNPKFSKAALAIDNLTKV